MNIKQNEDGSIYGDINEPWSPGFPGLTKYFVPQFHLLALIK